MFSLSALQFFSLCGGGGQRTPRLRLAVLHGTDTRPKRREPSNFTLPLTSDVWLLVRTIHPTQIDMKSRFTFEVVLKLAARALFVAVLLALPRALFAQTAEDYYNKGIHEERSDADSALADFDRALALKPDYAPAYYHRGLMKASKKDYDGAISDYDRAIQIDPNYARPYSARGYIRMQKQDIAGAIVDCDRAIALDPSFSTAYINRGEAKMAKKDFEGAIADFDQAIALNPKSTRAYRGRALAMGAKGDIDAEPDMPAHAIFKAGFSPQAQDAIERTMEIWGQGGGVVQVGFEVDAMGQVHDPFVISSTDSDLDQPAIDAALQSRYRPARHQGMPVNSYAEEAVGYYKADNKYVAYGDVTNVGGAILDIPDSKIYQSKLPPKLRYDLPAKPANTVFPVYPFELLRDDKTGDAEVGFFVSPTGKVEQAVSLHATYPEFSKALLAMVEQLKFQPAMKDGKPSWAVMTLKRKFSRSSDDVQVSDETLDLLNKLRNEASSFCALTDLDAQPKPLLSPPPVYPSVLLGSITGGLANVEILIDEHGNVQLPHVVSATDDAFGYAAVQSVSMWRFAPPTSHGQPVVVRMELPVIFTLPKSDYVPAANDVKNFKRADMDQLPVPILQTAPQYPFDLKSNNISGTVMVGLIVDTEGHIRDAHVLKSSGYSQFDQAAIEAISKWVFKPGRKNGQPVNVPMEIPITFSVSAPPTSHSQSVTMPKPDDAAVMKSAKVFNLDDLDQKPKPILQKAPQYPFDLKHNHISGTVIVGFIVDSEGHVQDAQVIKSSGYSQFDQAAVEGVSKWLYEPGRKDGHDVNVLMDEFPVSFFTNSDQ